MALVLDNCLALVGGRLVPKQLLLSNGKIAGIADPGEETQCQERIDCGGKIVLPGLIDSHVHFRVPGGEHKEDWRTGSMAAIAGGITTVIDMPNNSPSCTTQHLLDEKRCIAKQHSFCGFAFHFGASNDNLAELKKVSRVASFKVFMGSSTGELLVTDPRKLKRIFSVARERGIVVTLHAEDEALIQENTKSAKERGWNHARYHSRVRSNEAESVAVEKALRLQSEIGNRLHFCHISTKDALALIGEAKSDCGGSEGAVTCEVTPHHLFLDESFTEELGNFAKMNPSLKSKCDVKALWRGIARGVVDTIASDHAPHSREEKQRSYWEAPSGVPGCETMLPLLLDAVGRERVSLHTVAELCCSNPAKLFGLSGKGLIQEGFDADLVLVDLERRITIKNGCLYTKCNWSPFASWKLRGFVERVFVGGKEVKLDGA